MQALLVFPGLPDSADGRLVLNLVSFVISFYGRFLFLHSVI
jgi:hypothetical protein